MKLPVVCPEATVTLAGTVRLALLLERDTANPPADAAEVKVTEQGVLPGVLIVELVQLTVLRAAAARGREIAPEPPVAAMEVPPAVEATTLVS